MGILPVGILPPAELRTTGQKTQTTFYPDYFSRTACNLKSMACSGATGATLDGSLVSSVQLGNGNEELLKLKIDQGAPVSITLFGTSQRVMHYPNY